MLKSIHITNFVLIESLDMEFHDGFSVMTGQTGAGKSIILGALNLLLGARADLSQLRQGADRCTIEGHFSISGYGLEPFFTENGLDWDPCDTILRRELSAAGKSRAFINDTPVQLSQLKELGSALIDIHSQHRNLALGTQQFQFEVVDTIAGDHELLESYREAFRHRSSVSRRLEELRAQSDRDNAERDYLSFQLEGLESARLIDGEQDELEQESSVLEHAEEIKHDLYMASGILDGDEGGILQDLRQAVSALRQASANYPQAKELHDRADSCLIELKDIAESVCDAQESVCFDSQRQDFVNGRLDLIYSLEKKHGRDSIAGLLALAADLRARLDRADSCQDEINALGAELKKADTALQKAAAALTKARKSASESIEKDIRELLVPLGIPNVQFRICISESGTYSMHGHDDIRFMFSANTSVPMQDIEAVASGGEIARVMLSIKSLMAGARMLPTIIFDEIDTGVSGAVAEKMALLMKRMSQNGRQVLAITHLPQIAAIGQTHYKVFKTDESNATRTGISMLGPDERVMEIASMMSGATLTQAAIDNAKALIDNNGR